MYTLRNVENNDHILAVSANLTEIMAIKLYNFVQWKVQSAIYDELDSIVGQREIERYMYHLELNRRIETYSMILDRSQLSEVVSAASNDSEVVSTYNYVEVESQCDPYTLEDCGKTIDDCVVLAHSSTILVPSTIDGSVQAPLSLVSEVVNMVADMFAKRFGGSNVEVVRQGRWFDSYEKVVLEDCTPVNVRFDAIDSEVKQWIVNLAANVQRRMSQESVYFEIDGIAHLLF